ARKFCDGLPNLIAGTKLTFDQGWQLKIYSPYSGERTIAVCDLPQAEEPSLRDTARMIEEHLAVERLLQLDLFKVAIENSRFVGTFTITNHSDRRVINAVIDCPFVSGNGYRRAQTAIPIAPHGGQQFRQVDFGPSIPGETLGVCRINGFQIGPKE